MSNVTIFHNPACGTSRNVLGLIRHAGIEPDVIEYLKTPPSKDEIRSFAQNPILMNRPIVKTPLGVKLCRPSEDVLELLPVGPLPPFTKEDGEVVRDTGVRRGA